MLYLEDVGEVPEVEDVVELDSRGEERGCDFLVKGCERKKTSLPTPKQTLRVPSLMQVGSVQGNPPKCSGRSGSSLNVPIVSGPRASHLYWPSL